MLFEWRLKRKIFASRSNLKKKNTKIWKNNYCSFDWCNDLVFKLSWRYPIIFLMLTYLCIYIIPYVVFSQQLEHITYNAKWKWDNLDRITFFANKIFVFALLETTKEVTQEKRKRYKLQKTTTTQKRHRKTKREGEIWWTARQKSRGRNSVRKSGTHTCGCRRALFSKGIVIEFNRRFPQEPVHSRYIVSARSLKEWGCFIGTVDCLK